MGSGELLSLKSFRAAADKQRWDPAREYEMDNYAEGSVAAGM